MKTGKSLTELAAEIERQSSAKSDFLVPNGELTMNPYSNELAFQDESLAPTQHAHNQLASYTGIGTRYYQKLQEDSPAMLAGNVNHWLHHEKFAGTKRMVRELDGQARAFLSDKYLRLDNDVTAQTAFRALSDVDDVQVVSCDVTPNKMYIKAVFPRVEGEVKVGDIVQSGVIITNSEVGTGSFEIIPMWYRLWCLNGCTNGIKGNGVKRRHLGSRVQHDDIAYSQKTIELAAQATLSEAQDAIRTFTSPEYMQAHIARLTATTETVATSDPVETVERLSKQFAFNQDESKSILERFIRDQDYTQYGALNAVTNLANDVESYDRASQLEAVGGRILDLSPNQWSKLAVAA